MCLVREKWPLSDHRRCCCEFLCVPVNSGDSLTDVSQTFFEEVNLTKLMQDMVLRIIIFRYLTDPGKATDCSKNTNVIKIVFSLIVLFLYAIGEGFSNRMVG